MIKLSINCCRCGKPHIIEVDEAKFIRWKRGKGNIQDIFPELTPDQRELMISQICQKCWVDMFGEE